MTVHTGQDWRIKHVVDGYLDCAEWLANNDDDLDGAGFSSEMLEQARADCETFLSAPGAQDALGEGDWTWTQVGHDLWLTRNGHGTGFWDRDCYKDRDLLSEAARKMGECDLYLGDDGQIYCT